MADKTFAPDFRLYHIGVNAADEAEAMAAANLLAAIFDFTVRDTDISVYGGEYVEIMKGCGRGSRGHIAFSTADMDGAIEWLRAKGIAFHEETVKRNAEGNYGAVYIQSEICGFTIHLVERH